MEDLDQIISQVLVQAADEGIKDIKEQMTELDMNVSLKTSNSLRTNLVSPIKVEIIAEQSILTLVFGRKPGKMPPVEKIKDWVDARGLPEGSEWGIAINIGKFGTQIFQGIKPGIDIERTKAVVIDLFKEQIGKVIAQHTRTLVINLYR